jgi:hypothetical protein
VPAIWLVPPELGELVERDAVVPECEAITLDGDRSTWNVIRRIETGR